MFTVTECKEQCERFGWEFVQTTVYESVIVKSNGNYLTIPMEVLQLLKKKQDYIEDSESLEAGYERYSCGC